MQPFEFSVWPSRAWSRFAGHHRGVHSHQDDQRCVRLVQLREGAPRIALANPRIPEDLPPDPRQPTPKLLTWLSPASPYWARLAGSGASHRRQEPGRQGARFSFLRPDASPCFPRGAQRPYHHHKAVSLTSDFCLLSCHNSSTPCPRPSGLRAPSPKHRPLLLTRTRMTRSTPTSSGKRRSTRCRPPNSRKPSW